MTSHPSKKYPAKAPDDIRTHEARVTRVVEHLLLEKNLCVYRISHAVEFTGAPPASLTNRYVAHSTEGFARPASIRGFISGKSDQYSSLSQLCLVPEGFRDHAQQHGFVSACEKFGTEIHEAGNLFDRCSNAEISLDDLVILDNSSHMLFDRNGEVLPTAKFFDYMSGNIRNGAYDLDKALEILRKNPRATPLADTSTRRRNPESTAAWAIQDVPYYNVSPGCNRHLSFTYSPTLEEMRLLWDQMKAYKTSYPSTENYRAMFDLDILGLRAGGAAKHDSFYGSDEYSSSGSDDSDD